MDIQGHKWTFHKPWLENILVWQADLFLVMHHFNLEDSLITNTGPENSCQMHLIVKYFQTIMRGASVQGLVSEQVVPHL